MNGTKLVAIISDAASTGEFCKFSRRFLPLLQFAVRK